MPRRRDSYVTARIVRRELAKLGVDKARRIMVKVCGDCPCHQFPDGYHDPECWGGADLQPPRPDDIPPHDCPLRQQAYSIAIDPGV